jgi:signal transduction histidine kinase/ligand-binding sensor domain-containing protein
MFPRPPEIEGDPPSADRPFITDLMPHVRSLLRALCWLALGWSSLPVTGQQLAFRHFGLRDGLPQSQVTALLEDHRGFLWVGTNTGGMARLGASGFQAFGAAQGLKARFVQGMVEDGTGHIWVGSENGVSEVQGNTVANYGPDQGLGRSPTLSLTLDGSGRVLVGNRLGLYRQGDGGFEPVSLPPPFAGQPIRFLAHDRANGLWMVSSARQVGRWDGQALRLYPLPPGHGTSPIRDLQVDPAGRVWILLEDALLRMERGAWVQESLPALPPSPKMASLRFDPQGGGMLVSLGGDGLLVKRPGTPARRLTAADGLPRDRILVALRDRRGILWVGSDGDGLAAQVLPGLASLDGSASLSGKDLAAVTAIRELSPGQFLLASSTGLYRVDEGRGITARWTRAQGLPADQMWSLLPDGKGGVWVGTDRGLARWRDGHVAAAGPRELARTSVLTLVRDRGRILAGTEQGLFVLDEEGRLLSHAGLPAEAGSTEIAGILRYRGQLLLASPLGLWRLAGDTIKRVYEDAPFASVTVTCMTADDQGHLWVGTMNGLHVLSGGKWTTYGVAEGLGDDSLNFIADLGRGCMAFGHNRGVDILEGKDLHHLTRSQGLISDETNHNGYLVDARGRLWVGMIGGVNILDQPSAFRNPPLRPPTLLEIRWPGGVVGLPADVTVPPHPDFLEMSFDTGEPIAPAHPRYETLLEGVDPGWRPLTQQGLLLHYRNLGAGEYRLRLRVSEEGGPWVEARPIRITVQPAWYEAWAVRILFLLLVLTLLGGLVWLRIHRLALRNQALEDTVAARTRILERQNRALEQAHGQIKRSLESRLKLMDMVTHDLRSPLTSIMLTLDRLRDLVPDRSALIDIMDRETNRIETLVRNLLDQSRSEALLHGLRLSPTVPMEVTEGFEDVLRLKAEARGLAFHLEVAPETARVRIQADTATLHQVMLNLFENALKFTPTGGELGIRSTVDPAEGLWCLEVWDTGRGLDPKQIQDILEPFRQVRAGDAAHGWGLGLSICQDILEVHGGRLHIVSEPGKGASFRMVLPLLPEGP